MKIWRRHRGHSGTVVDPASVAEMHQVRDNQARTAEQIARMRDEMARRRPEVVGIGLYFRRTMAVNHLAERMRAALEGNVDGER